MRLPNITETSFLFSYSFHRHHFYLHPFWFHRHPTPTPPPNIISGHPTPHPPPTISHASGSRKHAGGRGRGGEWRLGRWGRKLQSLPDPRQAPREKVYRHMGPPDTQKSEGDGGRVRVEARHFRPPHTHSRGGARQWGGEENPFFGKPCRETKM